uniref:Uncharacterized protein n=1 Tax=Micrurus surinamensis TaxID=129470 RepID=A0A2D4Q0V9_MICSU
MVWIFILTTQIHRQVKSTNSSPHPVLYGHFQNALSIEVKGLPPKRGLCIITPTLFCCSNSIGTRLAPFHENIQSRQLIRYFQLILGNILFNAVNCISPPKQ